MMPSGKSRALTEPMSQALPWAQMETWMCCPKQLLADLKRCASALHCSCKIHWHREAAAIHKMALGA